MATKIWLMALIISTIFIIGAVGSRTKDPEGESLRLAARDVITVTINEVSSTRKFVNSITRLKTVDTQAIVKCVGGLINSLSNARSVLKRLRHLNKHAPTSIHSDAMSLEDMGNRFGDFKNMCQVAPRDVDRTIVVILNRKLEDIKLLTDDVVQKVSQLKLD